LLLLDEPLSNLDASLRALMRAELRRLQRQVGVTTLYVTHDQSEALSMSNRVAVMEAGHIVQVGRPREIYRRPATRFVASFVGRTNLLQADVLGAGAGEALRLDTRAGVIEAVCPTGLTENDAVSVSIRPENIVLHEADPRRPNVLPGHIRTVQFLGEAVEYHIEVGKELLIGRHHPDVVFRRGSEVFVELPTERCVVVSDGFGTTGSVGPADEDDDTESWTEQADKELVTSPAEKAMS
jgi:iron(III) transport system ATP-binding protein